MQNLIQLLEKTLVEAREAKTQHAQQIEALQAAWKAKLEQERVELLEAYEQKITDLRHAHAIDTDALNEDFKLLKKQTEEAREILGLESLEQIGVLDTSTIQKRMLFEKLAERWDFLSVADVEMIEAVLDGKVLSV